MDYLYGIVDFIQKGGFYMYPILVVFAFGVAIAIERYLAITKAKKQNIEVWEQVQPMLEHGRFEEAQAYTEESDTPIGKILNLGLGRQASVRRRDDIEIAMEEGMMEVLPTLEKRTHYLALFANISTLLGLLGTIMGLIDAFKAVADANPADKANLLSHSIAIAMNTTAFGLIAGIPLLILHAVIVTKTTEIVDNLEMAQVKTLNLFGEVSKKD